MGQLTPLLDLLLPRTCHLCGTRLSGSQQYLCPACLAHLPRTNYHRRPDNPMEQRFAGIVPYNRCAGHFFYTPGSDPARLIHDLKYHHFRNLGRFMGELMGRELLTSGFLNDCDCIVPIPMHFIKKARRGYNQTEEIARGLSQITGIPVCKALQARQPHKTQTSLTHAQRLSNTEGIFSPDDRVTLPGHNILLLDDVCTTGATLTSAALALLQSLPDARFTILTLAVTF